LKELDIGDAPKKTWWDCIVSRMAWKVQACPKRMHSLVINGEGESRGQPANRGLSGKWAIFSVCAHVLNLVVKSSFMLWNISNLGEGPFIGNLNRVNQCTYFILHGYVYAL